MNQYLRITAHSLSSNAPSVSVKVERLSDRRFLSSSGQFTATRGTAGFFGLTPVGDEPAMCEINLQITPGVFTDGRYIIYYYDTEFPAPRLFDVQSHDIVDGSPRVQRVPTTTDFASRLMQVRIGDETLRATLARIKRIEDQLTLLLSK